ncbi:MAG: hypothetical protein Fur0034_18750 [Desulfuromonadia bacterium]
MGTLDLAEEAEVLVTGKRETDLLPGFPLRRIPQRPVHRFPLSPGKPQISRPGVTRVFRALNEKHLRPFVPLPQDQGDGTADGTIVRPRLRTGLVEFS